MVVMVVTAPMEARIHRDMEEWVPTIVTVQTLCIPEEMNLKLIQISSRKITHVTPSIHLGKQVMA